MRFDHRTHPVQVDVFDDNLTIRRLPQLWLRLTILKADSRIGDISVLRRANGSEFYSLTASHDLILPAPPFFPEETLVKGANARSQLTLDAFAPRIAALLDDEKTKEIAITQHGLRMIWQLAEGKRGDHLLLRQSVFDGAQLTPEVLIALLDGLLTLTDTEGANRKSAA